jgi:hypothetical protein
MRSLRLAARVWAGKSRHTIAKENDRLKTTPAHRHVANWMNASTTILPLDACSLTAKKRTVLTVTPECLTAKCGSHFSRHEGIPFVDQSASNLSILAIQTYKIRFNPSEIDDSLPLCLR